MKHTPGCVERMEPQMQLPVILGLMDPLYDFFGMVMGFLYDWLRNYGLVVILTNILVKLVLMPLQFKTQKSMAKQQFMQDDLNEIKRIYAKDPQKSQEAQMELMKANGVSMGQSCLPMLLNVIILFGFWPPIQRPLHYIGRVAADNVNQIGDFLLGKGFITDQTFKAIGRTDIPVLAALQENGEALAHSVENGWIQLKQVLDLNFLGMDLGRTPSLNPRLLFGAEWTTYVPLLILVVLMMVTMVMSMQINKLNTPRGMSKEEREREKRNPAKRGQTPEQAQGMMKTMNIVFPVMMLFMSFSLPAAMTLFYLTSNLMAMLQSLLSYYLYTKPMNAILDEKAAAKVAGRRRNNS